MAKKDFLNIDNPAMSFINAPKLESSKETPRAREDVPESEPTSKRVPKKGAAAQTTAPRPASPSRTAESKSKRLQLLVQPSLLEALKKQAKREKLSVNEMINGILWTAVKGE